VFVIICLFATSSGELKIFKVNRFTLNEIKRVHSLRSYYLVPFSSRNTQFSIYFTGCSSIISVICR